jgi:hypothetical protein
VSRKFFDFARIKREDFFEVVVVNTTTTESRNALAHKSIAFMGPNKTAKLKIRGYPAGTIQLMFLASFLLVQIGVPKTLAVLGQKDCR